MAESNSMRTHKRCAECGGTHCISNFNRDKQQLDGYAVYCKPCRKLKNALRYQRDKEKIKSQTNSWKLANKSKKKEAYLRWYEKNADRVCRDGAVWRSKNRSKVASFMAAYRARKLLATPKWADKEAIESVYELAKALTASTGVEHHVDHIVPLQSKHVCGLHCESNLRAITWKENRTKSNSYWPDMP